MNTLVTYLKLSLLVTVSLHLGCTPQSEETAAGTVKKIIVALEPDKDPDAMLEDRAALESYLSETTGKPVEAIVPMSSAVIYEGLRNGTIDLAYLSATAAAKLIEQDIIDILVAELIDGMPYYQSYWITLKEAPYQSIAELKGQPIAFSSRTSTSGFLIPVWDLYTQGLIDLENGPEGFFGQDNVFYGVGYVSAAERVLRGEALAAAVSYYVLDKDKHLSKEQRERLRMLDSQGPVPSHVVVVRKGLNDLDQTALQAALLEMNTENSTLRDRIFGAELAPAEAETHLQTTLEALEISRTMQF
jgi:phosphonate transport system substrate-binding protein